MQKHALEKLQKQVSDYYFDKMKDILLWVSPVDIEKFTVKEETPRRDLVLMFSEEFAKLLRLHTHLTLNASEESDVYNMENLTKKVDSLTKDFGKRLRFYHIKHREYLLRKENYLSEEVLNNKTYNAYFTQLVALEKMSDESIFQASEEEIMEEKLAEVIEIKKETIVPSKFKKEIEEIIEEEAAVQVQERPRSGMSSLLSKMKATG